MATEKGQGPIWRLESTAASSSSANSSANDDVVADAADAVDARIDNVADDKSSGSESGSGSKPTVTFNVPNPAVTYGGLNPEIEENVLIVESVPRESLRSNNTDHEMLASYLDDDNKDPGKTSLASRDPSPIISSLSNHADSTPFLDLPTELIDAIISWLTPLELATTSRVCRSLRSHALSETQWRHHVLSNLPGNRIASPYPCKSWRELYISHDPYWFLTEHKVWFCDRELTGRMIIARYDERRGCIEGYQMVAKRARDGSEPWASNQDVHIHYFEPTVKLHLDKPILQLNIDSLENIMRGRSEVSFSFRHFFSEQPMRIKNSPDPRFSNFLLAKPLSKAVLAGRMAREFPYGYVWPPPAIPAHHRVTGQPTGIHPLATSANYTRSTSGMWQPQNRSEASDQIFRIRQWMEMGPHNTLAVQTAEEVVTYSTLDPRLYTPTAEKPWRGIWVGDYSGHGCEFLLINQPEDEKEKDEKPLVQLGGETEEEFKARFLYERVYRGRLEAIKLTGDGNVPRGEYSFIADDLGEEGYIGISQDPPFQGARVVKSKGHIAGLGFTNDKYTESRLLLLSHNRLACHWLAFGHISFFERVDIDQFLKP